jgi:hypothetical protein
VGRFASAFAFLAVLAVVLISAGCGQRFDELGGGSPPGQASFAADALTALEEAGSAHVVVDAQAGAIMGTKAQVGVHFEGDLSTSAFVGDVQLSFPGGRLGARVLADEHDVYVRFMGAWYHEGEGIADAFDMAGESNGELLSQLTTPAGLGKLFAQLFEGEITQGPDMAGASTWEFDGRLRAKTFANLVEEYGGVELTANDRALFEKVAAASHLVVHVGQGMRYRESWSSRSSRRRISILTPMSSSRQTAPSCSAWSSRTSARKSRSARRRTRSRSTSCSVSSSA